MPAFSWNAISVTALLVGLLLIPEGVAPPSAEAQETQLQERRLVPHPESRFWIQGRATGRSFTCEVDRVDGSARLPAETADSVAANEETTEAAVAVPVEAFNCGNDRMTRDLQETLGMEEHPEIHFELVNATRADRSVNPSLDPSHWHPIETLGTLTIAGTKRLMRIQAVVRALGDDHFRVRGCKPIRMTYFNIEPPTKAFGLIRVQNRVEVQFDLLAQTETADRPASLDTLSLDDPPSCE